MMLPGNSGVRLRILVRGTPITEYPHEDRIYVEGRDDTSYEIEIYNGRSDRLAAVLSVDGLSAMDGKAASANSGAYVLRAYETLKVPGWRVNNQGTAIFTFGGNYAEQMTGSDANNGIIGAIFYSEKKEIVHRDDETFDRWRDQFPIQPLPYPRPRRDPHLSTSLSASVTRNMGTGFGDFTKFETVSTTFNRDTELGRIQVFYDDARGLRRRGIVLGKAVTTRPELPQAFPADGCEPPPGWRAKAEMESLRRLRERGSTTIRPIGTN